jgi:hypothetical protein
MFSSDPQDPLIADPQDPLIAASLSRNVVDQTVITRFLDRAEVCEVFGKPIAWLLSGLVFVCDFGE